MTCVAEKEGKYCATWRSRYLRFSSLTRELSYTADAGSCDVWKRSMTVQRISRQAEKRRFEPGTFERREILGLTVEGVELRDRVNTTHSVLDDVEQADVLDVPSRSQIVESWTFRFSDDEMFSFWWNMIREALVEAGLMRPLDGGLPPIDFRFHLPYARVPLELLFDFRLLDTAVFFFVEAGDLACTRKHKDGPSAVFFIVSNGVLVVGESTIYVLRQDGMIVRWLDIAVVERISCGADFLALECGGLNADIVFQFRGYYNQRTPAGTVKHCADVISALRMQQSQNEISPEIRYDESGLESFLSLHKFKYFPSKEFSDHVTCPQSKVKLAALREQQLHARNLPHDYAPDFSPTKLQATRSKRTLLSSPPQQPQVLTPLTSDADPSLVINDDDRESADSIELDEDDDDLELQLSLHHAVHGTADNQQIDLDEL